MPNKRQPTMQVTMTGEEIELVTRLAKAAGFRSRSEYVRDLIMQDAKRRGEEITFTVTWGGWRGGGAESE